MYTCMYPYVSACIGIYRCVFMFDMCLDAWSHWTQPMKPTQDAIHLHFMTQHVTCHSYKPCPSYGSWMQGPKTLNIIWAWCSIVLAQVTLQLS